MTDINSAAGLYGKTALQGEKPGMDARESDGPSFGDMLKSGLQGMIDAQHQSEKVSAAAVSGNADMTEVLDALTNAEMTLNTVVAVRDRVIQAYQEIMRMPI